MMSPISIFVLIATVEAIYLSDESTAWDDINCKISTTIPADNNIMAWIGYSSGLSEFEYIGPNYNSREYFRNNKYRQEHINNLIKKYKNSNRKLQIGYCVFFCKSIAFGYDMGERKCRCNGIHTFIMRNSSCTNCILLDTISNNTIYDNKGYLDNNNLIFTLNTNMRLRTVCDNYESNIVIIIITTLVYPAIPFITIILVWTFVTRVIFKIQFK